MFSQENDSLKILNDSLSSLKNNFEEFEYGEVITGANSLLQQREQMNDEQLIEIFKMKGISHFSLAEDQAAQNSFIEIMQIDSSFSFDTTKTSPKILTFFNQVKAQYSRQILEREQQTVVRVDTVFISEPDNSAQFEREIKQSVFRSILFPGLGHLYLDYDFKGWMLSALSAISLGSIIYFVIETNEKEGEYLRGSNETQILASFKQYNKAYRFRNISIITYAALWLYAQIDLLFFSDHKITNEFNFSNHPQINYDPLMGFQLRYKLKF